MLDSNAVQIKLIRKYLKLKILEDKTTFRRHHLERKHVYDLMKKTISHGESHSALIIGPRGTGKTTLINSVLQQLSKEVDLENDAIVINLNGLVHNDEKVALKAITAQMQLENAVGDRVFGTFAENLSFLLSCIQSGGDRRCRSMLFLLDEFDLFCRRTPQTLLYNLFDVAHSGRAPVCVLGITSRLDVMDLLEKRVKSRFSHRHIFIFPNEDTGLENFEIEQLSPLNIYKELFIQLLSMPTFKIEAKTPKRKSRKKSESDIKKCETENDFSIPSEVFTRCKVDVNQFYELEDSLVKDWNRHVASLLEEDSVIDALEKLCYFTVNEQIFRDVLFRLVCKLSPRHPYVDTNAICLCVTEQTSALLCSLSVLELSLLIAMDHALKILDEQSINFEMLLHRYTKFANTNSSTQSVPRPVILKAFEHLQSLEIIVPLKSTDNMYSSESSSRIQKEYQLFSLAVSHSEIEEAVKNYKGLPTEISHWFNDSLL